MGYFFVFYFCEFFIYFIPVDWPLTSETEFISTLNAPDEICDMLVCIADDLTTVITLSDLECDYLNARTCCDKLNKWIIPEIICHNLLSAMLLVTGHWVLFLMYCSLGIWIAYKYLTKPSGDIGIFDPTEVHNRQKLKTYMRESLIKLGYHLFYFFVYLYWMIYSLLKGT